MTDSLEDSRFSGLSPLPSPTAVENHIARLRVRGLLARVGSDRAGHWKVLLT